MKVLSGWLGRPQSCLAPKRVQQGAALAGVPLQGCCRALHHLPAWKRGCRRSAPAHGRHTAFCKMYVPSDSFGGVSPEKKAAQALQTLFTFIAVKVVLAQLEGSRRGSLASMNPQAYETLHEMLQEHPMKDGDAWVRLLLQRNEMLAVRILEVRAAYSQQDFEWDQMQRLAQGDLARSNTALLQAHAQDSFSKRMAAESGRGSEEGPPAAEP